MSAILTHEFFGRDAYDSMSLKFGLLSNEEHEAFLIGNQGPDPLFYLALDPRGDKRDFMGNTMHHQRPALLLASLHDALSMIGKDELDVARAYAAGFLCHYLLDSTMHPLVFSAQYGICDAGIEGLDRSDGSQVHAEIERDLDEMVLYVKTAKTIRDFLPYREVLKATDRALGIIDKLYFYMNLWTYSHTVGLDCYTQAVRDFRLIQHLLYNPGEVKSKLIGPLEHAVTHKRYSLYHAMAHRVRADVHSAFDNADRLPWVNPFTGEVSTDDFWDLYDCALSRVPESIEHFLAKDFDHKAALELTGGLNFSGQPVDPDATEDPAKPPVGVTYRGVGQDG